MTKKEIYSKLLKYNSIDRIQLVRADYKGTNEGFNEQLTNIINELQSDYDMKYYKRLNDLCMILDKAENENDLDRIKNIKSQIESHEKTIENPFLISLKKEIENYIQQSETQQQESKGILTNESYYKLLENCTIEAFDSLKLKELYPKNGTKASWDISSLRITKGNGLPTERDNELYRKEYIKENMRVTFLIALDRYCTDFEIKHSMTRDFFYKKCYQSILFKISNSSLWHEPDFGFDIDKEPCKLTFIWNMRIYIEDRSTETKKTITPEAPQQPETNKPDEVKKSRPKHNPNDWNTDCFELFKYLIDNYYNDSKRTNTKIMCIWFYLSEYNPEKYILNITKDNYLIFIKENYGITITNKDKPQNYDGKVLGTLHDHRKNFEDSLK